MSPVKKRTFLLSSRSWLLLASFAFLLIVAAHFIHPVLAVTSRVDADVLIVEGWVADSILVGAMQEFHRGNYAYLFTSGLELEKYKDQEPRDSYAAKAARQLIKLGAPPASVIPCPTPQVSWNRTSSSARAVRYALQQRGIVPKGINVLTAGPHGRETWVAYRRIFNHVASIGIISIPNETYEASRWWESHEGRRWVFKNIAGWTKEVLIGSRS